MNKYEKILKYNYAKYKKDILPRNRRAVQFMPFQALKGYDDLIRSSNIYNMEDITYFDDYKEYLNYNINIYNFKNKKYKLYKSCF